MATVERPTSSRQPTRPGPEAAARLAHWALFAGVTGCVANGLLLAYYASSFALAWAGPANDVVGGVLSTTATIPVLLGLPALLPHRRAAGDARAEVTGRRDTTAS